MDKAGIEPRNSEFSFESAAPRLALVLWIFSKGGLHVGIRAQDRGIVPGAGAGAALMICR